MSQLFETSAPAPLPAGYVHVALEQGIDIAASGLTYAVDASLADLGVGERVRVPLGRGNRLVSGWVVQRVGESDVPAGSIKFVRERQPRQVRIPEDLVALARWIAGYYCCPIGMALATMLPAAVKKGTGTVSQSLVGLAAHLRGEAGETPPQPTDSEGKPIKLSALQRAAYEQARAQREVGEDWLSLKDLADLAGARSVSPVKQLVDKGVLELKREQAVRSDLDLRAREQAAEAPTLALNDAQQHAVDEVVGRFKQGFNVNLLHGVTGSGKTEVYLRIIEGLLAEGTEARRHEGTEAEESSEFKIENAEFKIRNAETGGAENQKSEIRNQKSLPGVIVLVPEIALTPQTVGRFLARFEGVAVLHSGLTASQRHEQWQRIRRGKAHIVVGARSAVFAPLADLRLVIVDEEHEPSYKQDQAPRYHGRDVAIRRAHMHGAAVVLGSATPSLESYVNAVGFKAQGSQFDVGQAPSEIRNPKSEIRNAAPYHLLRLPDRAPGMKLPEVEIVDLKDERRKRAQRGQKGGIHLLSLRLEELLGQTVEAGGQALLLLNRRGYANYIACPDHHCGWVMTCDYCDTTMVYHRDASLPTGGLLRCHHCEAEQLLPKQCPLCAKKVTVFGLGTQRVEEELARKLPNVRAMRMDSDAMRTGRDYEATLERFGRGEVDVLLGTQMIAKGLDFPGVRLVGVISADTALHLPDFRATERTFQLIAQVAGRAGRSDRPGRVVLQTLNPGEPAIQLAAGHDYEAFAERELGFRATVGLPPLTRLARIVLRDEDHQRCEARARELEGELSRVNQSQALGVRVRGPTPCPIARIAGYHRWQVELIARRPGPLQALLTHLRNARRLGSDMHMAVDVDPVALL